MGIGVYCSNHPASVAIGTCSDCGKSLCQACSLSVNGQLVCKACVQKRLAGTQGQANNSVADKSAAAPGQKKSPIPIILMAGGVIIVGLALLAVLTVIFAAVIAAFVFSTEGDVQTHYSPSFTVNNINDTAVRVTFVDTGGATSMKGLIVEQPLITTSTIVDPNTEIDAGDSFVITDPKLAGVTHLVAASVVDGNVQVVIDMDV